MEKLKVMIQMKNALILNIRKEVDMRGIITIGIVLAVFLVLKRYRKAILHHKIELYGDKAYEVLGKCEEFLIQQLLHCNRDIFRETIINELKDAGIKDRQFLEYCVEENFIRLLRKTKS